MIARTCVGSCQASGASESRGRRRSTLKSDRVTPKPSYTDLGQGLVERLRAVMTEPASELISKRIAELGD